MNSLDGTVEEYVAERGRMLKKVQHEESMLRDKVLGIIRGWHKIAAESSNIALEETEEMLHWVEEYEDHKHYYNTTPNLRAILPSMNQNIEEVSEVYHYLKKLLNYYIQTPEEIEGMKSIQYIPYKNPVYIRNYPWMKGVMK